MHCIRSSGSCVILEGLGQLIGMVHNRTCTRALHASRKKAACTRSYVETGTNSRSKCNIFLKFYKNL